MSVEELSLRELEVFDLIAEDRTYSEVATILGISLKTVEFHVKSIDQKLPGNQRARYKILKYYFARHAESSLTT